MPRPSSSKQLTQTGLPGHPLRRWLRPVEFAGPACRRASKLVISLSRRRPLPGATQSPPDRCRYGKMALWTVRPSAHRDRSPFRQGSASASRRTYRSPPATPRRRTLGGCRPRRNRRGRPAPAASWRRPSSSAASTSSYCDALNEGGLKYIAMAILQHLRVGAGEVISGREAVPKPTFAGAGSASRAGSV